MSAFQVSANHIATLVDAAILHRMTSFYCIGESGSPQRCPVSHENREELLTMLADENLASLEARYAEPKATSLIGSSSRFPRHPSKALNLSPVALLKAVNCYEYQSCEHTAWRDSKAFAFCQALKGALVHALPGYEAANTWGIE